MKIGIVGFGSIGQRHARNFEQIGHQVRVYDPLTRRDFSREKDLYDWCDAAVICTPSWMHLGGLRACIERDKHCLVEKPICTSSPDSIEPLLVEAKRKGLVVMMGNNLRFNAVVASGLRYGNAPEKPTLAVFTCFGPASAQARSDGVLLSSGSHEVDLALHLFGPAHALPGALIDQERADFAIQHDNGCLSTFHLAYRDEYIRQVFIMAQRNYLVDLDRRDIAMTGQPSRFSSNNDSWDKDYQREANAFIGRIEGTHLGEIGATGDDGLATLRVLLDVQKKAMQ